jgi:hypothetical protein
MTGLVAGLVAGLLIGAIVGPVLPAGELHAPTASAAASRSRASNDFMGGVLLGLGEQPSYGDAR